MKDNYGLLIASIVAIVAIVGLVILFSGANTGAQALPMPAPLNGPFFEDLGPRATPAVKDPCYGKTAGTSCFITATNQWGTCQTNIPYPGVRECGTDLLCNCDSS